MIPSALFFALYLFCAPSMLEPIGQLRAAVSTEVCESLALVLLVQIQR